MTASPEDKSYASPLCVSAAHGTEFSPKAVVVGPTLESPGVYLRLPIPTPAIIRSWAMWLPVSGYLVFLPVSLVQNHSSWSCDQTIWDILLCRSKKECCVSCRSLLLKVWLGLHLGALAGTRDLGNSCRMAPSAGTFGDDVDVLQLCCLIW